MRDLYIISERGPEFWGTHQIAEKTSYGKYEPNNHHILSPNEFQNVVDQLKGKRVLVYIHGLRNTKEDVCTSYNLIKEKMTFLKLSESYFSKFKKIASYYLGFSNRVENLAPYDVIIGYSWPSFDHEAHYYKAKDHAKALAPKLSQQLLKLSKTASKVDVMAHSMGNLLLFEALSKHADPNLKIDHIYSVAAAVPDQSIHQKGEYSKTLNLCNLLFVFHSKHDYALGWPYYLAENQTYALGLLGPDKYAKDQMDAKVKVIDTSEVIKGHSEYFSNNDFYQYLLKIHNRELDLEKSHFQIEPDENRLLPIS